MYVFIAYFKTRKNVYPISQISYGNTALPLAPDLQKPF